MSLILHRRKTSRGWNRMTVLLAKLGVPSTEWIGWDKDWWINNKMFLEYIYRLAKGRWKQAMMLAHPDCGGSHNAASELNIVMDRIKFLFRTRGKLVLIFLLACYPLVATSADVPLIWAASSPLEGVYAYRLYSIVGTNRVVVSVFATNAITVAMSDGIYQLGVTAINPIAESDLSLPLYLVVSGSNVVAITTRPGAPINLQLR